MAFAFVPLAHPDNVFGRGWYCTDWAWFGFAILAVVDGTLDPCAEAGAMLFGQFVDELSENVPVQSGHQVLVVLPLGQSGCSLAGGFLQELFLDLPPWLPDAEVIRCHIGRFWS